MCVNGARLKCTRKFQVVQIWSVEQRSLAPIGQRKCVATTWHSTSGPVQITPAMMPTPYGDFVRDDGRIELIVLRTCRNEYLSDAISKGICKGLLKSYTGLGWGGRPNRSKLLNIDNVVRTNPKPSATPCIRRNDRTAIACSSGCTIVAKQAAALIPGGVVAKNVHHVVRCKGTNR